MLNVAQHKTLNTTNHLPITKPSTPYPIKPKKPQPTSHTCQAMSPLKLIIPNTKKFLMLNKNRQLEPEAPILDGPRSYCEYYKTSFQKRKVLPIKKKKDNTHCSLQKESILASDTSRRSITKDASFLLKKIEPGTPTREAFKAPETQQMWAFKNMHFRTMNHPLAKVKNDNQYSKYINSKIMNNEMGLGASEREKISPKKASGSDRGGSGQSGCEFKTMEADGKSPQFRFSRSKNGVAMKQFKDRLERASENNLIQTSRVGDKSVVWQERVDQAMNCASDSLILKPVSTREPFGRKKLNVSHRPGPLSIGNLCKSGNEVCEKRLILANPKYDKKLNVSMDLGSFSKKFTKLEPGLTQKTSQVGLLLSN
jgi:hypothetical protein